MTKTNARKNLKPNYGDHKRENGRSHFSCSFTITRTQIMVVDQLIKSDLYASKSEIVRMALNDFIIKHAKLLEKL